MGSKNHEVVPTELIVNLSQLKHGSVRNILKELTKNKLVSREANAKCKKFLTFQMMDIG